MAGTHDERVVKITARRFSGETWSVRVEFPDGSYAHHRGLVDYGHAADVASRAIWKAEEMIANRVARDA